MSGQAKGDPVASDQVTSDQVTCESASIEDLARLDIRVGRVINAQAFPEARKPAYKLLIDFGELGQKSSSAQITHLYQPAELIGRLVVAVVNFKPRRIAGFSSEVLVLGVEDALGRVALLTPDRDVPVGRRIY